MNKLTAKKCLERIDKLKTSQRRFGISIFEEEYLEALEIALPVLEQQEKANSDWIEWDGIDNQPDITPKVQIKRRDGVTDDGYLNHFEWDHIGDDTDIIAYRVVEQEREREEEE